MKMPAKSTAITPHITVRDVKKSVRFYEKAFAFKVKFTLPGRNGKIMHAEMEHEGCTLMIGPESEERGMLSPMTAGIVSPVSIYIYVNDLDAQHAAAVAAGAKTLLEPSDQFFGAKTSMVMDPDGHSWMLAQHQKDMTVESMKQALNTARTHTPRPRSQPEGNAAPEKKAAPAKTEPAKPTRRT